MTVRREAWKADDARRNYDFAIRCLRERCIRDGRVLPREGDPIEERWAQEGVTGTLETVRGEP